MTTRFRVTLMSTAGGGGSLSKTVKPNEEWAVSEETAAASSGSGSARPVMSATLKRSSPFVPPFE